MTVSAASTAPVGLFQTRAALPSLPASDSAKPTKPTAREEFDQFASMTPAERMRASILQQMGVTEDQLSALSVEDRKAMEAKISDRLKEVALRTAKDSGGTGLLADLRA